MIDAVTCLLCALLGAGVVILAQRASLKRYFELVECLWTNDLKRIDDRINALRDKKWEDH